MCHFDWQVFEFNPLSCCFSWFCFCWRNILKIVVSNSNGNFLIFENCRYKFFWIWIQKIRYENVQHCLTVVWFLSQISSCYKIQKVIVNWLKSEIRFKSLRRCHQKTTIVNSILPFIVFLLSFLLFLYLSIPFAHSLW